jgi:hypothetical protein
MDGEWLTYRQLAEKLGTSAEGARRRAQRGRWTRQRGNDGQARVLVPEDIQIELHPVRAPSVRPDSAGEKSAQGVHLVASLEAHVETLKAELEHRDAEVNTLKAELGTRNSEVAAANARASEESAKTTQAIAAFESLAQRLEEIAAAKRPWWRRLVG